MNLFNNDLIKLPVVLANLVFFCVCVFVFVFVCIVVPVSVSVSVSMFSVSVSIFLEQRVRESARECKIVREESKLLSDLVCAYQTPANLFRAYMSMSVSVCLCLCV